MSEVRESLFVVEQAPVLRLHGSDVVDLLQRISTNDMSPLGRGLPVVTLFTTEKGRIAEAAHVVPLPEHRSFVLVLFGAYKGDFREWLSNYVIMEDVQLDDRPVSVAHSVLFKQDFGAIPLPDERRTELLGNRYLAVEERYRGRTWARIIDLDGDLRSGSLLSGLLGVPLVDAHEFEEARITAGIPLAGKELTDSFNPMETLCREYVSFTKGCYVGQEVIARLDSYRKVSRVLVRVQGEGEPRIGILMSGDKEAGLVTSAIRTREGAWMGLGFVKEFAVERTDLHVEGAESILHLRDDDPFGSVYGS